MNNVDFTRLLQRTANASERHSNLCDEVNEECVQRYGITYSDADADSIIDVLDLGGGHITATEFDEAMQLAISFR